MTKGLQRQVSGAGKVTKQDRRLLYVITKYLLLVSISNISTVMMLVWWTLEATFPKYLPQIAFLFASCDNLVNSLSLHLQFAFGNGLYKKLCNLCHQCIKQQMIKRTIPSAMVDTDGQEEKHEEHVGSRRGDLTLTSTTGKSSTGNDSTKLELPNLTNHQTVHSQSQAQ